MKFYLDYFLWVSSNIKNFEFFFKKLKETKI